MLNKDLHLVDDLSKAEKAATRDGFGKGLLELGEKNKDVVGLCADLKESVRMNWFAEKYPERYIAVGVAEQNLAGVAAGLAFAGKIPFASSFSVFSPGRNWDQLRVSICYSKANVKLCSSHAGLTVGEDGATHQALEDIAITRVLPNLVVIVPSDALETKKATIAIAKYQGPVYMRFSREKTLVYTTEQTPFEIGKALVLKEGNDATVIACGIMVAEVLKAAEVLEKEGISVEVINNHTIKPIDVETIINSVKKTKAVVTAEEHQKTGGLRGAVLELLAEYDVMAVSGYVAVEDKFGESGTSVELLEKYGLTAADIVEEVKKVVKKK
ncbi:transketolase family protein [Candidatus Woesearchaeota archaeon]|nr:transketolase family protein [Candidatus Woesearchaeota archaeon]